MAMELIEVVVLEAAFLADSAITRGGEDEELDSAASVHAY
jgi:hypothetical protein